MSRGRRCVPPAAGMRPSRTSVRPTRAFGVSAMIRTSHARAISSPPPMAGPLMAATVLNGSAASSSSTRCISRLARSASACDAPSTIPRSAPATNCVGFALMTTRPRGVAARAAAIAAARSSRRRASMAFTRSSGRSMTIRATPDPSGGTNVTLRRASLGESAIRSAGAITPSAPARSRRRSRRPRTRSRGRSARHAASSRSRASRAHARRSPRTDGRAR